MNRRVTIGLLIGCVLGLIGWDVYVVIVEPSATISAVVLGWAQHHPVVPFGLGVLGGHLCWPQRAP